MSKNCEFQPGFVEKMANNYNEAMSGSTEAAAAYKLYMAVADGSIKEDPSCAKPIIEGSQGAFYKDLLLENGSLTIPKLEY